MYTLILYDDNYTLLDYIEGLNDPVCQENSVSWKDGQLAGIEVNFIIIEQDKFSEDKDIKDLLEHDLKSELKSIEVKQEEKQQQMQIMLNEMMFQNLMNDPTPKLDNMQEMLNEMLFMQMTGGM